ncbi:MAG: 30S ribosomal protein S12 methylthiotransferase RimO [Pseudomonadota bacterium]|nr:30S ribosomal protein S12 methylthiotransferase RimO [Pseudomonadota bacterium]
MKNINQLPSSSPKIGLVSLGCPKALVDSEKILTSLTHNGYKINKDHRNADLVIVNTCGFIDSAKEESINTISSALNENGKVIITGCLGNDKATIKKFNDKVLSISGPSEINKVLRTVQKSFPQQKKPIRNFLSPVGVKLTPKHYSYLKISEGCNHKCKFCIIPSLRGKLKSYEMDDIIYEAKGLVDNGTKELLVISQDTSAFGIDFKKSNKTDIVELCKLLGQLDVWVRLHYLYPYPNVTRIIPLMADKKILPYLDIPFQHSHPEVLKRMQRPAKKDNISKLIEKWRQITPELTIRSTFIVGYPGETENEFQHLLDWLEEVQLDRVGCFKYENVNGAKANTLPNHLSEEVKEERWNRFMMKAQDISEKKLKKKIGTIQDVIIDELDEEGAICRTKGDAPQIDGNLFIDKDFENLKQGQIVSVKVDEASEYDLWGKVI